MGAGHDHHDEKRDGHDDYHRHAGNRHDDNCDYDKQGHDDHHRYAGSHHDDKCDYYEYKHDGCGHSDPWYA